jgi:SAM-dependent methyltransferase
VHSGADYPATVREPRRRDIWLGRARRWEGAPSSWGPNTGHPNEAARNRIVYRQLSAALEYSATRYASGRLVDIGCGTKPWLDVFAPYVSEHIGVDHPETLHGLDSVDVVADAYHLPFPAATVDTILLTEVLEHLERPGAALAECARLLRQGGHLISTTPFSWPVHEAPRDFFRYSPHGLRHLTEEAGLEVVDLRALSGIWTTLALHFSSALQRYRSRARPIVDLLAISAQRLAWYWERVDYQDSLSWDYLMVARRP